MDAEPSGVRIEVRLRSTQRRYLDHHAELDLVSRSHAFRAIVENYALAGVQPTHRQRTPRKVRQLVIVSPVHLAVMDRLAGEWGVDRSEVARRLIDRAEEADPIILG